MELIKKEYRDTLLELNALIPFYRNILIRAEGDKCYARFRIKVLNSEKTFESFIKGSFRWINTVEGWSFWHSISRQVLENTFVLGATYKHIKTNDVALLVAFGSSGDPILRPIQGCSHFSTLPQGGRGGDNPAIEAGDFPLLKYSFTATWRLMKDGK